MANHNAHTCNLSVIIVSRNEQDNIARCIESVLKATVGIDDTEIILVDSASTDKTIEIAMTYPIKIIQLQPTWRLSPAAGHYTGFLHSRGKYIQFLDGDMTLDENWFKNAIPILEKDNRIAGVSGIISQEKHNTKRAEDYSEWLGGLPIGEVKWLAGDTLFKRDVLSDVGIFNPYLRAVEEGELSYRVTDAGYKLLRLPYHMSHHLGAQERSLGLINKMLRYETAHGQVLRYSLNNKRIFWRRLRGYKFKLVSAFLMAFLFLAIISFFVLNYRTLLYVWIICGLLFSGWVLYEKRNIKDIAKEIVYDTVTSPYFMWGLLEPKRDPNTYPTGVKIIKG